MMVVKIEIKWIEKGVTIRRRIIAPFLEYM